MTLVGYRPLVRRCPGSSLHVPRPARPVGGACPSKKPTCHSLLEGRVPWGALPTCHSLLEGSVTCVGSSTPHAYDACGESWKEHCLRYPPLAVLGPPHTQRMCVETRVGTWPNLPHPCLVHVWSLSLCHSRVAHAPRPPFSLFRLSRLSCLRCTPRVAQGVVCHFFSAWRWHTEGAQGVLDCPLGITELS